MEIVTALHSIPDNAKELYNTCRSSLFFRHTNLIFVGAHSSQFMTTPVNMCTNTGKHWQCSDNDGSCTSTCVRPTLKGKLVITTDISTQTKHMQTSDSKISVLVEIHKSVTPPPPPKKKEEEEEEKLVL